MMSWHFTAQTKQCLALFVLMLFFVDVSANQIDTLQEKSKIIHRIELDVVPSTILHTNTYLKGDNIEKRTMNHAFTTRLKYAFQSPTTSQQAQMYKGVYQGFGVAYHNFNPQLGNPLSVFIFQGAKVKQLTNALSLNYEWNFGLTAGWHPYHETDNPENRVIGSKITAYLNTDLYLKWQLSKQFDLNAGLSLSHFSNGNTTIPNGGLNIAGGRISLAYYIHRPTEETATLIPRPTFQRHITYDFMLYGAWRKKGLMRGDKAVALPKTYQVGGFSFTPLYHLNPWLNVGISLDGVYDSSANLYIEDYIVEAGQPANDFEHLAQPTFTKQIALGLSGRAEFVMPYFTIQAGIGRNTIYAKGELNGWYQVLALKTNITNRLFLNIGYSLYNFQTPNHLMLGLGYHFQKKKRKH